MGDVHKGDKVGHRAAIRKEKLSGNHITKALKDAFQSTAHAVVQMQEAMHLIKLMEKSDDNVLGVAQTLKGQSKIIKNLDERIDTLERKAACSKAVILPVPPTYHETVADLSNFCLPAQFVPVSRVMGCHEIPTTKAVVGSASPLVPKAHRNQQSSRCSSQPPTHRSATKAIVSPASPRDAFGGRGNAITMGKRLLKAAHEGRLLDVQKLIAAGADVNYSGTGMWTPLHRAAARSRLNVLELLLKHGSDVNAEDCYGFTSLHMAAYNDLSARCVTCLIDAGANVHSTDRSGRTPLHSAAEGGNEPAVLALVAAGARKIAKDDRGRLAFDVAKDEGVRRLLYPYNC